MQHRYLGRTAIGRKILSIEYRLILFLAYLGFLLYLLISLRDWKIVLYTHIAAVLIFSIFYFGRDFLYILISPLIAIVLPILNWRSRRYLRNFKQNVSAETVVILAHSDRHKLEAWIKPNFLKEELEWLVKDIKARNRDFSFYTKANFGDVEKIMGDTNIKEVYFVGHGNSHVFQLCTDDILYYCDFNNGKYGKEFVHQVHCGTKYGKSLIDYVVPEENRSWCFMIRKPINSFDIQKEFKRRIKTVRDK